MLVDGRAIAADIYQEIRNTLSHMNGSPHLTVFTCAPNGETQKYLALKKRRAHECGIAMNVIEFPHDITTAEVVQSIEHAAMQTDGIVVQLPFPQHVVIDEVLACIPEVLDIDLVNYQGGDDRVLPPVVGAIKQIAERYNVTFKDARVVVVGEGRLVGAPSIVWARDRGAHVEVINKSTPEPAPILQAADILISGAGAPGLITPDMINDRVSIFDAGTSEDGGVLKGDVDPACADKAALLTPVPGGIGPVTVAVLLRNLVHLMQESSAKSY